jgi:hypothetical protein
MRANKTRMKISCLLGYYNPFLSQPGCGQTSQCTLWRGFLYPKVIL